MAKVISKLAALGVAIVASLGLVSAGTAEASTGCPVDYAFAVGGFNDPLAGGFVPHVDRVVPYSAKLNAVEEGIASLKNEVDTFRSRCPGSKVIISGHSQGAAIAHVYLSRHGSGLRNAAAVLYSDPKQHDTGESNGLFWLGGYPIAGTDFNFGGVPTVSVCQTRDVICSRGAGWGPYLREGIHGKYDFNPRLHAGRVGIIWLR